MRRAALAAAGVLVGVACGDNIRPTIDGVRSGSRLRAIFATSGETRIFVGFLDRARDERCTFQELPDHSGAICTSSFAVPIATEFLDDRCSVPLVPESRVSSAEPFARVDEADCDPPALWRLGDPAPITQVFSRSTVGGCVWHPAPSSERWYSGVARVPLEQMATGRLHVEDDGDTLRVRYVDGEDGSRQPIGMYDTRMDAACRFSDVMGPGLSAALGCYPEVCTSGVAEYFDQSCLPLVTPAEAIPDIAARCACAAKRFAVLFPDPNTDAGPPELWELGSTVPPPVELYRTRLDSCEYQFSSADVWQRAVRPVEARLATRTVVPGAERLLPIVIAADGQSVAQPWLHDTQLATECEPRLANDGALRCLPTGLTGVQSSLFADSSCTQPIRIASDQVMGSPVRWAIVEGATRTVYPIESELLPGNLFATGDFSECNPLSWDRFFERVYRLGPEAAPWRFAEMSEIID